MYDIFRNNINNFYQINMTNDVDPVVRNEAMTNSDKIQYASDRVQAQLRDYLRRRAENDFTEQPNFSGIHPSLINPNPILENYGGTENSLQGNTLDFDDRYGENSYEMSPARKGFNHLYEDITALDGKYNHPDNGITPPDDIRAIGEILSGDDLSYPLELKIRYDIALRAGLLQSQSEDGIPLERIIRELDEKYPFINTLVEVVDQDGTFYQNNPDIAARVVAYDMYVDALYEQDETNEPNKDFEIEKTTSWIDELPEDLKTTGRKVEAMSVASGILDGLMMDGRDPVNDFTDEEIRRYIDLHSYTAFGHERDLSEEDLKLIKRAGEYYNREGAKFGINMTEGGFNTTDDTIVNETVLDNLLKPSVIALAAKKRGNNFPVIKFLNKLRDNPHVRGHIRDIHMASLEDALLDDEPGMGLIISLSRQNDSYPGLGKAALRVGRVYESLMGDNEVS